MKALAVVGPTESGRTTLVERLTERLADRGRVGTIRHRTEDVHVGTTDGGDSRSPGPAQTYEISAEGWSARGDSLQVADALDRLAQSCEYAVVEGYQRYRLPKIVLGGRESGGRDGEAVESQKVLRRAASAEDVDVDGVLADLESVDPYETLGSLVERAKASPDDDKCGAIATFTGRVRARDDDDDEPTEFLEFEKYDGVAEEKLRTIREELEARDGIYEVLLHHRTGVVEAGEDIVFVVVLAGHRPEAFRTVEDGINRLKEEVPLFKKEVTVSDEFWAHEK